MIDKNLIGHEFEAVTLPVEEGRLRFVAKSIGETNPVYSDPEAARKAGYPALPTPPTFVFMLEVDAVDLQDLVKFFGCKLGQLLHGEQGFIYHSPIYAGDRITVKKKVVDIYDKKNGKLEFIITENDFINQDGVKVAETRTNYVIRN
jgi:acyl dehydratase